MSRPDMQTTAKGKAVKDALSKGGESLAFPVQGQPKEERGLVGLDGARSVSE